MAKKKKKFQETTIENYYDLRVDKVDELVAALKDDNYSPEQEVSMNISDCTGLNGPDSVTRTGKQKKFDPYKVDFLSRVPTFIKAIFIKWWFSGAVCFFIMFGINLQDGLDQLVLCGIVMGLVTDILVNPLFKYMESDRKEYNDYMMFPFPFKAFWTFFTNIVYYVIVVWGVSWVYTGISLLTGTESNWLEPLLFGVFCVLVDMILIGIKDGIVRLIKKSGKKENEQNV